jgi:hypothetical protein
LFDGENILFDASLVIYINSPNIPPIMIINRIYEMIYLLTAIGLSPGGSSTVHIYIQTIHRMTQIKQHIEQHKKFGRVHTVPRLCKLYPGICLRTEEKAWKNLSQGRKSKSSVMVACFLPGWAKDLSAPL